MVRGYTYNQGGRLPYDLFMMEKGTGCKFVKQLWRGLYGQSRPFNNTPYPSEPKTNKSQRVNHFFVAEEMGNSRKMHERVVRNQTGGSLGRSKNYREFTNYTLSDEMPVVEGKTILESFMNWWYRPLSLVLQTHLMSFLSLGLIGLNLWCNPLGVNDFFTGLGYAEYYPQYGFYLSKGFLGYVQDRILSPELLGWIYHYWQSNLAGYFILVLLPLAAGLMDRLLLLGLGKNTPTESMVNGVVLMTLILSGTQSSLNLALAKALVISAGNCLLVWSMGQGSQDLLKERLLKQQSNHPENTRGAILKSLDRQAQSSLIRSLRGKASNDVEIMNKVISCANNLSLNHNLPYLDGECLIMDLSEPELYVRMIRGCLSEANTLRAHRLSQKLLLATPESRVEFWTKQGLPPDHISKIKAHMPYTINMVTGVEELSELSNQNASTLLIDRIILGQYDTQLVNNGQNLRLRCIPRSITIVGEPCQTLSFTTVTTVLPETSAQSSVIIEELS